MRRATQFIPAVLMLTVAVLCLASVAPVVAGLIALAAAALSVVGVLQGRER